MSNSKFRRHVVSRGAQCPEDDMERNVGESKLLKGVQVICSITALKLKVLPRYVDHLQVSHGK